MNSSSIEKFALTGLFLLALLGNVSAPADPLPTSPTATPATAPAESAASSPTPSATPLSPVNIQQEIAQIVADYAEALVMVQGSERVGSGFFCNQDGRTYIISNAGLICANFSGFKLTNLRGSEFTPGNSSIAEGNDVMRMEVQNARKSFEVLENLESTVKIGDAVVVLGNTQEALVVKPLKTTIKGVGPGIIEVNVDLEPGYNGSPIIHIATKKVIGVATCRRRNRIKFDRGYSTDMRIQTLGCRFDNVKAWEPIDWRAFLAQSAAFSKIDMVSNDFTFMVQTAFSQRLNASNYKSPEIQRVLQSAASRRGAHHRKLSSGEKDILLKPLVSELKYINKNNLRGFNTPASYGYFQREMELQVKLQEAIDQCLSFLSPNSWSL